jgi:hypothetical protein
MKITLYCATCGKSFEVFPSQSKQKFCSIKCHDKTGERNPKWKGGRVIVGGYRYVYAPNHPNATKDGYVCEHRLVAEKTLGRYLTGKEVVHHIDENPLNNTPDNLAVCSGSGAHSVAFHLKRNATGKFGERSPTTHPNQKLTTNQTTDAVARRAAGETYRSIAESYGVTISCINAIVRKHRAS